MQLLSRNPSFNSLAFVLLVNLAIRRRCRCRRHLRRRHKNEFPRKYNKLFAKCISNVMRAISVRFGSVPILIRIIR